MKTKRQRLLINLISMTLLGVGTVGQALAVRFDCGQPESVGAFSKASDALAILRWAVEIRSSCEPNFLICDVNGDGSVTTTDALVTLRVAVGQNVVLKCKWGPSIQEPIRDDLLPPAPVNVALPDPAKLRRALASRFQTTAEDEIGFPWFEETVSLDPGAWTGVSVPASYLPEDYLNGNQPYSVLAFATPTGDNANPDIYTWVWNAAAGQYRGQIRGSALGDAQVEESHLFPSDVGASDWGIFWVYSDDQKNSGPIEVNIKVYFRPHIALTLPIGIPFIYTPHTIPVTAVMDNDLQKNGEVLLFDGTVAKRAFGCKTYVIDSGEYHDCLDSEQPNTPGLIFGYRDEFASKPLEGKIVYAEKTYPLYAFYDGHNGYDYAPLSGPTSEGVAVRAAATGTLVYVGGPNNEWAVEHDGGWSTHYLHMLKERPSWFPTDGSPVGAGYVIGNIGGVGGVIPHLHFTVKHQDVVDEEPVRVDPYIHDQYGYDLWTELPTRCPPNTCCPLGIRANGADSCDPCASSCGNDQLNPECNEQCDATNLNGQTCQTRGFGCGGTLSCNDCNFDTSGCTAVCCGDGQCNGNEACSSCASDCGVCPPTCGNGTIDSEEQCDGSKLNGQTCASLGYSCGGSLSCSSCEFNTSNCSDTCCGDGSCNDQETCSTCQTDCGPCEAAERITNGGFESGTTGWSAGAKPGGNTSSAGIVKLSYPHNGLWYAYLGDLTGEFDAIGSVHQASVSIPASASSAILTFWLNVSSSETTTSTAYDLLDVNLRRASNDSLLEKLATYSNLQKGTAGSYSKRTLDISDYIGQTITLQFYVDTDSDKETLFRFDDVSIIVEY
jgi:hypothetical protein